MGIASTQDIPFKEQPKSEWSMRALFPAKAMANAIAKVFSSPFDILLGFAIFVIGVSEIIGHHVYWLFYVFTFFLLFASFLERRILAEKLEKK